MLLVICIASPYGIWCIHVGLHGKNKRHLIEGALLLLAALLCSWLLTSRYG
jgi:hypothetical protein